VPVLVAAVRALAAAVPVLVAAVLEPAAVPVLEPALRVPVALAGLVPARVVQPLVLAPRAALVLKAAWAR
jgi:hypothetical protein